MSDFKLDNWSEVPIPTVVVISPKISTESCKFILDMATLTKSISKR